VTDLDVWGWERRLAELRAQEAEIDSRLPVLAAAKARAKQARNAAPAARDAALAFVRNQEPLIANAGAAVSLARSAKRAVNPRFARAEKAEPQLLEALEVARLPDAPEDKQSDTAFANASKVGGPVDAFYEYNAISHGLSGDPKFISKEALRDAWIGFQQQNPGLPKKAPWANETRKVGLKHMLESTKVPSAFKMQILRSFV
jgi:hypothetical protein